MVQEITAQALNPEAFIADKVADIRQAVGSGKAINALSGGVDSATVTMLGHRALGDRLRTVVTTAEPAMQGATVHRATLEATWDLRTRSCRWVRQDHTFGDRVRAEGTTAVEPRDDGTCTVVERGKIDVRIPVMGKKIARKVVASMEELAPRKAAFWEQRLRG